MSTRRRRGGVNDGAGNSTTSSFTDQLPSDLSQTDRVTVEQTTRSCNANSSDKVLSLHEKLAALQVKTKRMTLDLEKTKEIIDLNNLDTSKVILSDIRAMVNVSAVVSNNSNSNDDINVVEALKPNSLFPIIAMEFHGGPCDDEIEEEEEGWR
ncbi:hypothetical protein A2U01_0052233, partial [Trifolium medium]|nr:hypothetical protein [Trifolium medium]